MFCLSVVTIRNKLVAKVMFLQVCVCPQGGRVSASVHAGMPDPPDQADPPGPQDQAEHPPPGPGRHPPCQADTPHARQTPPMPGRHPPSGTRQTTPPDQADTPPDQADPPPGQADSSIRSTSGRYASYWNAFLLEFAF